MNAKSLRPSILLAIAIAALIPVSQAAPIPPVESGASTMTVTVVGKKEAPPAVAKSDVQLSQGKERKQVARWVKAEKLYLAILIDDSLDSEVASQWNDMRQFILAQPQTTSIAVGYASNATVRVAQDFTADHELAAKALCIPIGRPAESSSDLSVIDWMKRCAATGDPRSLLLISSGIDYSAPASVPFIPTWTPRFPSPK